MRRYELGEAYGYQTDLQINSSISVVFGFLDLKYLSSAGITGTNRNLNLVSAKLLH